MEVKAARRGLQRKESSVFDRLGARRGGHLNNSSNKICKFWVSGRCLKNPCRFAHSETPDVATSHCHRQTPYYPRSSNALVSNTWRRAPRNSQNVQEKVVNHKSSENVPGKSESDLDDIKRKAFLRVLQNVLFLKMILIWRMWLKKSLWSMFLRKPQKGFVSSGCKGRVSMVISALTYTHGFVGISSKGWQSFKGTTRHSMELHFL